MVKQGGVVSSLDTTLLHLYSTLVAMFFKSKHSGFRIIDVLLSLIKLFAVWNLKHAIALQCYG